MELEPEEVLFEAKKKSQLIEIEISSSVFKICFLILFFGFFLLSLRLYFLQIVNFQKYSSQAKKIYQKEISVPAKRSKILTADGEVLAETIKEKNTFKRVYYNSEIFSPVVGYVKKDNSSGVLGVEKTFDEILRGKEGKDIEIRNVKGEIIKKWRQENPQKGKNIILSLNSKLQKKLYEEIKKTAGEKKSGGIIFEVQTGKILALVSLPSDDSNIYQKKLTPEDIKKYSSQKKIFNENFILRGSLSPGSTIKPLISLFLLEEGIVSPSKNILCKGFTFIGKTKFKDWKAHGTTNLKKAIAESCDVYFYTFGPLLGEKKIKEYLDKFFWERLLKIDLPGEEVGFVPTSEWFKATLEGKKRKFSKGDLALISIGQGAIKTTPLHLAFALASIANGGKILKPQILKNAKPEILAQNLVSSRNIEIVKEGMKECTLSGTCKHLKDLPVLCAAKTGTAQVKGKKPTSWFVAFCPYDKPEIFSLVVIEDIGEGHLFSGRVTKKVLKFYFQNKSKKKNVYP